MAYICTTCGATTETPGHLCSPCDTTLPCNFCGAPEAGARHMCREKLTAVQYFCTSCGRVAEERSFLCNPAPVIE